MEISINTDMGSVIGRVIDTEKLNLEEDLCKTTKHSREINKLIKSRFGVVAILQHININESFRDKCNATDLVGRFIEESEILGAQLIIKIPEKISEISGEFNQEEFYRKLGLVTAVNTKSGPLMLNDHEFARCIQRSVKRAEKSLDLAI